MDIVKIFELIDENNSQALHYVQTVADINYQDKNGNTMLHRAAMCENHEVLDWLLTNKADVNIQNKSIFTALVISTYMQDSYAVEKLLKAGTDTELAESNGWTPLVIAVDKNSSDIVQLLVAHKAHTDIISTKTGDPLILSCREEQKALRHIFINAGANVLAGDSEGLCTIHQIIDETDIQALELLKKKDFDFNLVLPDGYTPLYQTALMYAVYSKDKACIEKLLQYKVDIHYQHPNSNNSFIGYLAQIKQDDIFNHIISTVNEEDFFKLKTQLEKFAQYQYAVNFEKQYQNTLNYLNIMNAVEIHHKLDSELKGNSLISKKSKI